MLSRKKLQIGRKIQLIFIISINRKTEAQLQQTAALRYCSSILAVTGKSNSQFAKFYNINRVLEPNTSGSKYAAMIYINQNKFCVVLYSCCTCGVSYCTHVAFELSRVAYCCTCVASCCTVVVLYCVVLSRLVLCSFLDSCSFLD